jgi:hypothetical protein
MTKDISLHHRKDEYIVTSHSLTLDGFWTFNGWVRTMTDQATDTELGSLLLEALGRSEVDVPTPTQTTEKERLAPILQAAGVRRYSDYLLGTKGVVISTDDDVSVTPMENKGMRGGFVELLDRVERLPLDASPEDIGTAARLAISRAISNS